LSWSIVALMAERFDQLVGRRALPCSVHPPPHRYWHSSKRTRTTAGIFSGFAVGWTRSCTSTA